MANNTVRTQGRERRTEPQRSAAVLLFRASSFTAINMNDQGEPRRLRHVSREVSQTHFDNGTVGEDDGLEPGFEDQAHGTDFRARHTHDQTGEQVEDDIDEEDEYELEVESPIPPAAAVSPRFHDGIKRKRSASIESATQSAASPAPVDSVHGSSAATGIEEEPRRGRKPGISQKESSRPWTDAECIALLTLYVSNPMATHKAIAGMHHGVFWRGDPAWEGRSFSACQQRLISLNNKSRDRARLPGVLAELKSTYNAAANAEADDSVVKEQKYEQIVETDEEDEELGGSTDESEGVTATQLGNGVSSAVDNDATEAARLLLSMSGRH